MWEVAESGRMLGCGAPSEDQGWQGLAPPPCYFPFWGVQPHLPPPDPPAQKEDAPGSPILTAGGLGVPQSQTGSEFGIRGKAVQE